MLSAKVCLLFLHATNSIADAAPVRIQLSIGHVHFQDGGAKVQFLHTFSVYQAAFGKISRQRFCVGGIKDRVFRVPEQPYWLYTSNCSSEALNTISTENWLSSKCLISVIVRELAFPPFCIRHWPISDNV